MALVYTAPHTLAYRDESDPEPTAGETLVRVEAVGICGSDMHGYLGHDARRKPPLILGHEVCGRALSGSHAGKSVVVNPLITCGSCRSCESGLTNLCRNRELIGMNRPGAFAQLLRIPDRNVIAVPSTLAPEAAALSEPAATALHAVRLTGRHGSVSVADSRCLVLGGGAIGLLAALELHRQGCRDIHLTETNPLRRQSVEKAGIASVWDPADCSVLGHFDFDAVIDAVGVPATHRAALGAVRAGGVICHTGLGEPSGDLDFRRLTLDEITLVGTYTYTAADFRLAVDALSQGAYGALAWIEQRPLSAGIEAFADLAAGRTGAPKIVLRPDPQSKGVEL